MKVSEGGQMSWINGRPSDWETKIGELVKNNYVRLSWESLSDTTEHKDYIKHLLNTGANAMLTELFPYLLSARGELMDLMPLMEQGDKSHLLKVRNLINSLNEIVAGGGGQVK